MSNYNHYTMGGGNSITMNYSCESFMDYAYEEDIVMESVISSIKERLKKICASLYRRCNGLYERNKQKHPKIANVFRSLAIFFKKHSNVVEKAQTKEDVQQATHEVEEAKQTMQNAEKKATTTNSSSGNNVRKESTSKVERKSVIRNTDGSETDISDQVSNTGDTKYIKVDKKTGKVLKEFKTDKDYEDDWKKENEREILNHADREFEMNKK